MENKTPYSGGIRAENKKARDIGLCEPQPDNHVAWSHFVPDFFKV